MSHIEYAHTPQLKIAYEQRGDGPPILLLHGWPDDVRTWDHVAPALHAAGYRTIAPWLRGYGSTSFVSETSMRSSQVVALAQDVVDLLDALQIERVTLLGHDWGARAGYAVAALFPQRIERLIALAGAYETGIKPGEAIKPEQAHAYWYQWFWHTERGREMLQKNRRDVCRYLWSVWSPHLTVTDTEFDATAIAWDNSDWVAITLHSYRVRWGAAPQDPAYAALQRRIDEHPPISVPTMVLHGEEDGASLVASSAGQEASFTGGYKRRTLPGVGHFIQRENPEAVIEAVIARKRS